MKEGKYEARQYALFVLQNIGCDTFGADYIINSKCSILDLVVLEIRKKIREQKREGIVLLLNLLKYASPAAKKKLIEEANLLDIVHLELTE